MNLVFLLLQKLSAQFSTAFAKDDSSADECITMLVSFCRLDAIDALLHGGPQRFKFQHREREREATKQRAALPGFLAAEMVARP